MLSVLAFFVIMLNIQIVQGSIEEKENNTQSLNTTLTVQNRKLVEACYSRNNIYTIYRRSCGIHFEDGSHHLDKLPTWYSR